MSTVGYEYQRIDDYPEDMLDRKGKWQKLVEGLEKGVMAVVDVKNSRDAEQKRAAIRLAGRKIGCKVYTSRRTNQEGQMIVYVWLQ